MDGQRSDPDRARNARRSPAIVARGLTKRFRAVTAVDDLSFEVRPGRVTGFLGPNGAGKSTTLRMVLDLVRPTSGTATVLGLPYASLAQPTRAVGAVLETQSFHPRAHRAEPPPGARRGRGDARGEGRRGVGPEWAWPMRPTARPGGYSLGMRQRLGSGRRAARRPSRADPGRAGERPGSPGHPVAARIPPVVRGPGQRGAGVEPLLSEMAQMADDVIVIDHGRLLRQAARCRAHGRRCGTCGSNSPDHDELVAPCSRPA